MLLTKIEPARARRTDPHTSHKAAAAAQRFASGHKGRILAALAHGPATARDLAHRTGLTVVQIDRRLPELQRAGLAAPALDGCGCEIGLDGCRVWESLGGGE